MTPVAADVAVPPFMPIHHHLQCQGLIPPNLRIRSKVIMTLWAVSLKSLIYGCLKIVHDRIIFDAVRALTSISLKARAQRSLIIENTSLYLGCANHAFTGARSARKETHGIEDSSTIGACVVFCECLCRFSCIPSRASSCTGRFQEINKRIQKKTYQKNSSDF
ncbi:hypothetical protein N7G274_004103 [Stereocaulon virgatum]|uniref:Uncharacterized protein n=1 Tax=Stereocaulon virgatum TaxID=373712 RepID=A0ABR4AC39_9LECA